MRRHLVMIAAVTGLMPTGIAAAGSWIFQPSYYSHAPQSCERVAQYRPEKPAIARFDPTYQESGYRHSQSSIRVGNSADHMHVVQTWGQGELIRPYGEWEYPYRAGATPFGPWGNPQGPWTLPFDSWQNPYGLGRLPQPPWPTWPGGGYGPIPAPMPGPPPPLTSP